MLDAARGGDREAYAELYLRHRAAAVRFATRLTGDTSEAHDLVSEAFIKLMRQLDRGAGPDGRPLAYLIAIMRNLHVDQHRRQGREVPTAEVVEATPPVLGCDVADRLVEGDVIASAFATLPDHYRTVLWHTEVLGRPLSEVADALGTNNNAVGVQAFRAREALREAYLAEHLGTVTDETCRDQARLIPRYVRGSLPENRRRQLEGHLHTCNSCAVAFRDLRRLNTDLSVLILPAIALGACRVAAVGGAASTSRAGPAARGTRAAVAGVGVALGVVAVVFLAVTGTGDEQDPARGPGEAGSATTVSAPGISPSARKKPRSPRQPGPVLPSFSATVAPSSPASPISSPPPPPPPPPSPAPSGTPSVFPDRGPPLPTSSLTTPYLSITRSSGAAALQLLSRITGLTEGTVITLTATNVTRPDTTQLDGWRCTQVRPRPSVLRLVCRAARSATPLFSVGLAFVDPDAPLTGTIDLAHGAQTLSFVATA